MESRRYGALRRSVMSALAAVLAAAIPSLVSTPAHADSPSRKGGDTSTTSRTSKADAKPKEKKVKKVASRTKGKKTAKRAEAPKRRCTGSSITIDRGGLEGMTLPLVDCRDRPVESSQVALSVLARPWGAQKPATLPAHPPKLAAASHAHPGKTSTLPLGQAPGELAPGVRLLDKGLLLRLDAISRRFPGRTLSVVSGYRPQSRGSLHQGGRAIDLRVAGVSNEELVAFCKTLPDTGCGYYPNSSFVHVDVRNAGTGAVSWIDSSGPGESPHYVRRWPPLPEESSEAVLPDSRGHEGGDDPYGFDAADEHAPDREPDPGKL